MLMRLPDTPPVSITAGACIFFKKTFFVNSKVFYNKCSMRIGTLSLIENLNRAL